MSSLQEKCIVRSSKKNETFSNYILMTRNLFYGILAYKAADRMSTHIDLKSQVISAEPKSRDTHLSALKKL